MELGAMEFRVLGPLQVVDDDGSAIPIPQPLIRAAICVLVVRADRSLTRDELMDSIWPATPSAGALRTCLYDVRRLIGAKRLVRDRSSYRLVLGTSDRTDLDAFWDATAAGERALDKGHLQSAAELFAEALSLWRSPPLQDFPDTAAVQRDASRLMDERQRVRDAMAEARLALGHYRVAISMLRAKVDDEPLNEAGWAQLMLALYRSGRPAEALQAYERAGRVLAVEASAEPGPQLQRLRQQIDNGDLALLSPSSQAANPNQELPAALRLPVPREGSDVTPIDINTTTANVARIYDYFLGGKDNYAADRTAAEKIIKHVPEAPLAARMNRAFIARTVRFLAGEARIRQFVDVGAGLPTQANVHEIAHGVSPDAHIVYVDNDPVVFRHAQALLADEHTTTAINRDLRRPEEILADARLRRLIDTRHPVGLLLTAILHFIPDEDDPAALVSRLAEPLPSGSFVVISHGWSHGMNPDDNEQSMSVWRRSNSAIFSRTPEQVARFFGDFELIDPGVVWISQWRPDETALAHTEPSLYLLGGVGRKA
jgi:DNA-binding SARP family transcriptional activator